MKTRNRRRGYYLTRHSKADRAPYKWREMDFRGETNAFDEPENYHPHGYHNPDYDPRNFWPTYHFHEDDGDYPANAEPQEEFIEPRSNDNRYGMGVPRNRNQHEERFSNQGYKRRRNNEHNPYYNDGHYYNPTSYDFGPFRNNHHSENHNTHNEFNDFNEDDNDYDYYESYPRFNNRAGRKDNNSRRSRSYTYGNEGSGNVKSVYNPDYNDHNNGKRIPVRRTRRPNIRDKKY